MLKVALAGNPNSGKTTLFNTLTGSSARVGNWPGVTIDKHTGIYKKLGEKIEIIDLPGLYSFNPYTVEEKVARDFILEGNADIIINIVDATNLERNLYLTTQLIEMDVPLIVALNFFDIVEKDNIYIDLVKLSNALGVPVVPISALKNRSIKELMANVQVYAKKERNGSTILTNNHTNLRTLVLETIEKLRVDNITHLHYHASKLLEDDPYEVDMHPDLANHIKGLKATQPEDIFMGDYAGKIADARYRYITGLVKETVISRPIKQRQNRKADMILTHKVWGIPIFALIMFFVFHLTFSEDLFYLGALGIIPESFDLLIIGSGGIASPGVMLFNVFEHLREVISALLIKLTANSSPWVQSLFVDGVWAGVSSVLSFLPQIVTLYLFISILEDTGYMSRVAFMLDRLTRKFGLSGRAFMPLLMSFGCAVPGIMATRTLRNDKERRLTILLSPFFSCGAKLPIWLVFGSILFQGRYTELIITAIYLIGFAVAILTGYIANRFFIKSEASPFIMEMPEYRFPKWNNVGARSWEKVKDYVTNAATIIAASMIVIWFLSSFSFNFTMVENSKESMIGVISSFIAPIFVPLGFGQGSNGWMFVVAAFTGLIAKEMVPSTLATIANVGGDVLEMGGTELLTTPLADIVNTLTPGAAFAFMAFNLLTIPCMAAVSAAKMELKSNKHFFLTLLLWVLISYISATLLYITIDFPIATIVIPSLFALAIIYLIIEKKMRAKKGRTNHV